MHDLRIFWVWVLWYHYNHKTLGYIVWVQDDVSDCWVLFVLKVQTVTETRSKGRSKNKIDSSYRQVKLYCLDHAHKQFYDSVKSVTYKFCKHLSQITLSV